jgi:tRNA-dihydrouridine synthase
VPARWDVIAEAVRIAREIEPDAERRPLIVGNGDVASLDEARRRAADTGCDGVMIGRGIFGNPWFFNPHVERDELPLEQVLEVMLEHAELYESLYDGIKALDQMKKHFKAYIGGFDGAAEVRAQLMEATDLRQIRDIAHAAMRQYA